MNVIRYLKNIWHKLSLHTQLSSITIFIVIFTIATGSYLIISEKKSEMLSSLKNTMNNVAEGISTNGISAFLANDYMFFEKQLSSSLLFDDIIAIEVLSTDGKIISQAIQDKSGNPQIIYEDQSIKLPLAHLSEVGSYFEEKNETLELWYPARNYNIVGWVHVKGSTERLEKHFLDQSKEYLGLAAILAIIISIMMLFVLKNTLLSVGNATHFAQSLITDKGKRLQLIGGSRETTELVNALNKTSEELARQQQSIQIQTKELEDSLGKLKKFNDLLEHKVQERTRELQSANNEIKQALNTKSEFLANMSHEIRTPLNAIIGIISVLKELNLSNEIKGYIKIQDAASRNLLQIISDILVIAKTESDGLIFETIPFDLNQLILESVNIVLGGSEEKDVKIIVDTDRCRECFFIGDPARVSQVMMNLLNNSMKFTEKGAITIRSSINSQNMIEIEVEDTGIGIPEDKINDIFEPFVQADSSITRKYGGTGLGLTICKNLIERMGGKIGIDSKLGKGTLIKFTLNLPRAKVLDIEKSEKPTAQIKLNETLKLVDQKRRILLVDDDLSNYEILKIYFKKLPIELVLANNGKEALAIFESESFDMILMDMQMPIMDGLTATKKIREIESQKHLNKTPVLMLTANAFKENFDASIKAGADDFVTKPVNRAVLLGVVEKYLEI